MDEHMKTYELVRAVLIDSRLSNIILPSQPATNTSVTLYIISLEEHNIAVLSNLIGQLIFYKSVILTAVTFAKQIPGLYSYTCANTFLK